MSKFGFKGGAFLLNILSCLRPNLVLTIWNPIVEPMEEKVSTRQVKIYLCWVADPRWIQCMSLYKKISLSVAKGFTIFIFWIYKSKFKIADRA